MIDKIKTILNTSIKSLEGIGESRGKLFCKLGIEKIGELITYYPRTYEDRSKIKKINELDENEAVSFEAVVSAPIKNIFFKNKLSISKTILSDETGKINAVWFNQKYIKNTLNVGEKYYFFGKAIRNYKNIEIQNPIFEKLSKEGSKNTCKIVPIYSTTAKLTENIIRQAIRNALNLLNNNIPETLPEKLKSKYGLIEINEAIRNIHFPESNEMFHKARFRLAFEELFMLQIALAKIKNNLTKTKNGIFFKNTIEEEDFINSLPYELTHAQKKVLDEIKQDMESNKVMNRLIQGDVGSGKTVIAAISLFKAVKNGYQGTFMVPTEILAEQHFGTLKDMFEQFNINVVCLTGSLNVSKKKKIYEEIEKGKIDIVIGTHALIQQSVKFKKLGLVVTDEQHRFGVSQRMELIKKGNNPDVLVMTATPIPRTLALFLYGDLDISIIDEMPPGRIKIDTYAVSEKMRQRINDFIKKNVEEGRQVYLVCPLVEESESIEANAAEEIYERVSKFEFKGFNVGLLHGRMRPAEKDSVMRKFANGEIDVLVSTTVIEVGVDVSNANLMVIENAERFGLSQLHQLRGRVGRGTHKSYCIIYNNSQSEIAKQRMDIMQKTNDGFAISEKDLELRGPGDFFGTRQHGLPDLKIANLYDDIEIMKMTQTASLELLNEDPNLEQPENILIKKRIKALFYEKLEGMGVN